MKNVGKKRTTPRKKGPPAESGRPAADRPAIRTCLCCGEKFKSTGWGNRMCPPCLEAPWREF
jgi:hypothetical protein